MQLHPLMFATIAVSIVNGIFSPWILLLILHGDIWFPSLLVESGRFVFILASLLLSAMTIMLSGVFAALFERLTGCLETGPISYAIWFGFAVFFSLPAIFSLLSFG